MYPHAGATCLVEVNVCSLESLQAVIDGLHDVMAGEGPAVDISAVHGPPHFGGQHQLLAQ